MCNTSRSDLNCERKFPPNLPRTSFTSPLRAAVAFLAATGDPWDEVACANLSGTSVVRARAYLTSLSKKHAVEIDDGLWITGAAFVEWAGDKPKAHAKMALGYRRAFDRATWQPIADELRAARIRLGLTVQMLGRITGITRSHLEGAEQGRKQLGEQTLYLVRAVLGLD